MTPSVFIFTTASSILASALRSIKRFDSPGIERGFSYDFLPKLDEAIEAVDAVDRFLRGVAAKEIEPFIVSPLRDPEKEYLVRWTTRSPPPLHYPLQSLPKKKERRQCSWKQRNLPLTVTLERVDIGAWMCFYRVKASTDFFSCSTRINYLDASLVKVNIY